MWRRTASGDEREGWRLDLDDRKNHGVCALVKFMAAGMSESTTVMGALPFFCLVNEPGGQRNFAS